jgi:hypothetical protein
MGLYLCAMKAGGRFFGGAFWACVCSGQPPDVPRFLARAVAEFFLTEPRVTHSSSRAPCNTIIIIESPVSQGGGVLLQGLDEGGESPV